MKFAYALFAFASIASSFAATPFETITSDVAAIHGQVTSLDRAIGALPDKATVPQVVAIATIASTLIAALNVGATHAGITASLDPTEAQIVVDDVKSFVPEVTNALKVVVVKHDAFPTTLLTLVGQTLRQIDAGTQTFADALIKNAQPNVLNQVIAIKVDLSAKFKVAEAAFPV